MDGPIDAVQLMQGATLRTWSPEGLGLMVQDIYPCEVMDVPRMLVLRFLRLAPRGAERSQRTMLKPRMEDKHSIAFQLPRTHSVVRHADSGMDALQQATAFITAHARLIEIFPILALGVLLHSGVEPFPNVAHHCQPVPEGLLLRHRDQKILVPHPSLQQVFPYLTAVINYLWTPYKSGPVFLDKDVPTTQHGRLHLIHRLPQLIHEIERDILPVLCPTPPQTQDPA